jgi:hypothetical protein
MIPHVQISLVLTDPLHVWYRYSVDDIHRIFQVMHHVLKDNLFLYDVYLHMSSHVGIHKILTSSVEKTKEILRVIEAIEADPTPVEQRFKPSVSVDPATFDLPVSFDGYTSFCDSLKTILQRERLALGLLELLCRASCNDPEGVQLHSLVEQTRRHIQLLQDRLDLESMLST